MEGMEYLYSLLCELQARAPGLQGPSFFFLPVEGLLCEKLGKISFNSLKCLEGCRNTVEVLVSKFFESRVIVFICIFSQNLAQCMKFTMSILFLGKILYNSSLTDIEELVYILCPVSS